MADVRAKVLSHKKSSEPLGVQRRIHHDRRRHAEYLRYEAYWQEEGQSKIKTFQVGRVDEMSLRLAARAREAAYSFRKAYELSCRGNYPFNASAWDDWRQMTVRSLQALAAESVRRAA